MGTGYTRNDTGNNIADGNVINAADLDGEFDAVEAAFATTGHTHDGTAAEGGPVSVTGPAQEYVSDGTALYPKTDDTYDLGKTGAEWKDLYVDGTANIDSLVADTADINAGTIDGVTIGGSTPGAGTFSSLVATTADINAGTVDNTVIGGATPAAGTFTTVTASGTVTFNGNTVIGNAATDTVTVTADVASNLIPSADNTYDLGAVGSEWKDLYIDGTANIDSLVADTADINGGTIDGVSIGASSAATGLIVSGTQNTAPTVIARNGIDIVNASNDGTRFLKSANNQLSIKNVDAGVEATNSIVQIQPNRLAIYALNNSSGSSVERYYLMYEAGLYFGPGGVTGPILTSGTGSPEGVVSAWPGSIYVNESGGAGTTLYIKESGTGNTGWVAK